MGKDNNPRTETVVIDGVEYDVALLSDEEKQLISHVADLDRKLSSARFNVDQLQVGRNAFFGMLKEALEKKEEAKE